MVSVAQNPMFGGEKAILVDLSKNAHFQDGRWVAERIAGGIVNTIIAVARKISLTGDATGNTTFDGTADKSIAVTLANTGVTAGTYSAVAVDAKGRVTAGSQIVEWGTSGQTTPSANLAVGGLFFMLVE